MGGEDTMRGKWVQAGLLASGTLLAQTSGKSAPVDPSTSADRALKLVGQGRCKEAPPILQRAMPRLTDKDLRYHTAMGLARCAMAREDTPAAVAALMLLRREFPDDPEVLFVSVHYYSHMATRASAEIAAKAPTSFQARRLEAEAFESQGKWDERQRSTRWRCDGPSRAAESSGFRMSPPTATLPSWKGREHGSSPSGVCPIERTRA